MSSPSDTATPVVIITAPETLKLTTCVKDFMRDFVTNPDNVRFINATGLPLHGLRTIEFIGFSLTDLTALDIAIDNLRDFYLPELTDEILVTINPSAAHLVKKH